MICWSCSFFVLLCSFFIFSCSLFVFSCSFFVFSGSYLMYGPTGMGILSSSIIVLSLSFSSPKYKFSPIVSLPAASCRSLRTLVTICSVHSLSSTCWFSGWCISGWICCSVSCAMFWGVSLGKFWVMSAICCSSWVVSNLKLGGSKVAEVVVFAWFSTSLQLLSWVLPAQPWNLAAWRVVLPMYKIQDFYLVLLPVHCISSIDFGGGYSCFLLFHPPQYLPCIPQ